MEKASESCNFKLLLLTHGRFGEELLNSAGMIAGGLDNIIPVALSDDQDPEDYKEAVLSHLAPEERNLVIITDIFAGTPYKTALGLLERHDAQILTGLCMAMLLEVPFARREPTLEAAVKVLREIAASSCRLMNRSILFSEDGT